MLCYLKNVKFNCVCEEWSFNGISLFLLQETCPVSTYDNSPTGLAKLNSLLFVSIRNALCVD